jgi:RNA polymerase sigma-70 factor (ECF subfamily)
MEVSDNHLIILLKNDDKEAYKLVFRTYYRQLYYLAIKYIKIHDEANDLTQTSFIKFWENRSRLVEEKSLKAFLFTLHKNNCIDYLRKKENQLTKLSLDAITELEAADSPESLAVTDLELRIFEAIATLPPKCRQIFELSRFRNLKYSEIAEKLNVSVKTVENQIGIAIQKLRLQLADYLPLLILFLL